MTAPIIRHSRRRYSGEGLRSLRVPRPRRFPREMTPEMIERVVLTEWMRVKGETMKALFEPGPLERALDAWTDEPDVPVKEDAVS